MITTDDQDVVTADERGTMPAIKIRAAEMVSGMLYPVHYQRRDYAVRKNRDGSIDLYEVV